MPAAQLPGAVGAPPPGSSKGTGTAAPSSSTRVEPRTGYGTVTRSTSRGNRSPERPAGVPAPYAVAYPVPSTRPAGVGAPSSRSPSQALLSRESLLRLPGIRVLMDTGSRGNFDKMFPPSAEAFKVSDALERLATMAAESEKTSGIWREKAADAQLATSRWERRHAEAMSLYHDAEASLAKAKAHVAEALREVEEERERRQDSERALTRERRGPGGYSRHYDEYSRYTRRRLDEDRHYAVSDYRDRDDRYPYHYDDRGGHDYYDDHDQGQGHYYPLPHRDEEQYYDDRTTPPSRGDVEPREEDRHGYQGGYSPPVVRGAAPRASPGDECPPGEGVAQPPHSPRGWLLAQRNDLQGRSLPNGECFVSYALPEDLVLLLWSFLGTSQFLGVFPGFRPRGQGSLLSGEGAPVAGLMTQTACPRGSYPLVGGFWYPQIPRGTTSAGSPLLPRHQFSCRVG